MVDQLIRAATVTMIVAISSIVPGQVSTEPRADEAAIRQIVAAFDAGTALPRTSDTIFWSGAWQRPTVEDEKPVEAAVAVPASKRKSGSQRNKSTVVRVEVAESRDMAYEFSTGVLTYETVDGKEVTQPNAALRVWRKQNGEWKVVAQFSRPTENPQIR
jgi:hypothetical protein